jgi:hypothetical protein
MKQQTRQLALALPQKMEDGAVLALWHFLNSLIDAFDLTYGHQIRCAFLKPLPEPAPQQMWLPFINDDTDLS